MRYLEVPFPDNPAVKALGARFDRACKKWYVPEHLDPGAFERWLPHVPAAPAGPGVSVRVVLLPDSCWRCHAPIRPVVGVELPAPTEAHPDGFVGIDLCAEAVAATLSRQELGAAGAGEIQWRTTRVVRQGYWANTCPPATPRSARSPSSTRRCPSSPPKGSPTKTSPAFTPNCPPRRSSTPPGTSKMRRNPRHPRASPPKPVPRRHGSGRRPRAPSPPRLTAAVCGNG